MDGPELTASLLSNCVHGNQNQEEEESYRTRQIRFPWCIITATLDSFTSTFSTFKALFVFSLGFLQCYDERDNWDMWSFTFHLVASQILTCVFRLNGVRLCSQPHCCGWSLKPNQSSKLYTSLFIYATLAGPLRLPSDRSQKKKPQGTPESDWCLTDTPEQPMREEEMRGSGQVTVEDKCWVRWIKVQ